MQLQFDKNQAYQLEAIESVVNLFEGQPLQQVDFELSDNKGSLSFTETGVANNLVLAEEQLLSNLNKVQRANELREDEVSTAIEKVSYKEGEEGDGEKVTTDFPNYSIEMETGTGKTYVYLRTIYELNKRYGFKKFVIVVPSVAIREGVLKSLQITFDHFQEIYENQPLDYNVYDSSKLTGLGSFARSTAIQILVINIDSFTKDANVINQVRETGIKPIEYIQKSRPVVIMDEPQNMETDIRKKAIANLNPLFTLRYSATHKHHYNLVYKLDPVKAYDLGLVKQIEVDSVVAKNDVSGAYVSLDGFKSAKRSMIAMITIFVNEDDGVVKKQVKADCGDNLFSLSKKWDVYREGFNINEMSRGQGNKENYIEFSSGKRIYEGEAIGGVTDDILKGMIDITVENHFKKEKELSNKGIKVLSLFFIDRVANYRDYDEQGNAIKGKYATWFEESFNRWKEKEEYKGLIDNDANAVHNGYFSQDKGKFKDTKEGKSTKVDDETFQLIMRDKERLLDVATPLRFIFSHSALREGWDNPNVFQICTLNETKSDIKKRQEIGRGLRLCVDQSGNRVFDKGVNRLTVIANEAYEAFSKMLQKEIEYDCGVKFEGRIKNARQRQKVKLRDKWLDDGLFRELWDKIKYRTEYKVNYSTENLIQKCVASINAMEAIKKPSIHAEKNKLEFIKTADGNLEGLKGEQKSSRKIEVDDVSYDMPNLITYIQSKTNLTRSTIIKILLQSTKLGEIFNNPQLFMDEIVGVIKNELDELKIAGIKYEKIAGAYYEMQLFESNEIEHYLENLIQIKNKHKTLYDFVAIDSLSTPERKFAEDCDSRDDILFYVKLPRLFQIRTPIGSYNPDWALIKKENGESTKIYFVAETKSPQAVKDKSLLRSSEQMKIKCAEKHFEIIDDVRYQVVGSVSDLHY